MHSKNTNFSFIFLLFLIFSFNTLNSLAQSNANNLDTLLVGIAGNEPFVFNATNKPTGIAIETWNKIATNNEWHYKYIYFETVEEALQALTNDEFLLLGR